MEHLKRWLWKNPLFPNKSRPMSDHVWGATLIMHNRTQSFALYGNMSSSLKGRRANQITRGAWLAFSLKSVLELQQWYIIAPEKHAGAHATATLLLTVGKLHTCGALDGYALGIFTNTISHWTYCAGILKAYIFSWRVGFLAFLNELNKMRFLTDRWLTINLHAGV